MKKAQGTLFLLAIFALSLTLGCKDDPPATPVSELLIGIWESIEKRENEIPQPASEGYRIIEFKADSTVIIDDFEEDGAPIETIEDTWLLTEKSTVISFGVEDPFDIAYVDADSLIVEYKSIDQFSGMEIQHSDTFLKD